MVCIFIIYNTNFFVIKILFFLYECFKCHSIRSVLTFPIIQICRTIFTQNMIWTFFCPFWMKINGNELNFITITVSNPSRYWDKDNTTIDLVEIWSFGGGSTAPLEKRAKVVKIKVEVNLWIRRQTFNNLTNTILIEKKVGLYRTFYNYRTSHQSSVTNNN